MNLDDLLTMDNIKKIADKVGVDQGDVMNAAKKVLPKITGGIKGFLSDDEPEKKPETKGATIRANPFEIFKQASEGKSLDEIIAGGDDAGNAVLEAAFGDKDGSRAVAAETAKETGVDESAIKKMLPNLASLVADHAKDLDLDQAKDLLGKLL